MTYSEDVYDRPDATSQATRYMGFDPQQGERPQAVPSVLNEASALRVFAADADVGWTADFSLGFIQDLAVSTNPRHRVCCHVPFPSRFHRLLTAWLQGGACRVHHCLVCPSPTSEAGGCSA